MNLLTHTAIMTEESQKMKKSLEKLEEENRRLSTSMMEKDAALIELNSSLKQVLTKILY